MCQDSSLVLLEMSEMSAMDGMHTGGDMGRHVDMGDERPQGYRACLWSGMMKVRPT